MPSEFQSDVFLSHSAKDKAVVRPLAERLRQDGLKVWFDEWVLKPGDSIPAKIEEGLEHSRVLVLCMSANAFGSDWAQLEAGTFRFRDPLNQERHFIPLRLDDAPIKGSLAQFLYINWRPADRENEYAKLLEACRPPGKASVVEADVVREQAAVLAFQLDSKALIHAYAFSADGRRVLTGGSDNSVRLWDLETQRCLRVQQGHTDEVMSLVWSADERRALSGSKDKTLRLWDVETGHCLLTLEGHNARVLSVVWSADERSALSGAADGSLRLWDVGPNRCLSILKGHTDEVLSLALSTDRCRALSGAADTTMRLWDLKTGHCLRVLEGHADDVWCLNWSFDQRLALSGSSDGNVRLWDVETGRCLRVLEGHVGSVLSAVWSATQRYILSSRVRNTTASSSRGRRLKS
ncbi:MAG: TIR domain-containing protein [Verrucomicrobia bacterium]|nr:TIR domain-containing protein [Verrucomicrobiota bacterium]